MVKAGTGRGASHTIHRQKTSSWRLQRRAASRHTFSLSSLRSSCKADHKPWPGQNPTWDPRPRAPDHRAHQSPWPRNGRAAPLRQPHLQAGASETPTVPTGPGAEPKRRLGTSAPHPSLTGGLHPGGCRQMRRSQKGQPARLSGRETLRITSGRQGGGWAWAPACRPQLHPARPPACLRQPQTCRPRRNMWPRAGAQQHLPQPRPRPPPPGGPPTGEVLLRPPPPQPAPSRPRCPLRKPQACTCCGPSLKAATSLPSRPRALLLPEDRCTGLPGNAAARSEARARWPHKSSDKPPLTEGQCTSPVRQAPVTQRLPWPGRDPCSAPANSKQAASRATRGLLAAAAGTWGSRGPEVRWGAPLDAKPRTQPIAVKPGTERTTLWAQGSTAWSPEGARCTHVPGRTRTVNVERSPGAPHLPGYGKRGRHSRKRQHAPTVPPRAGPVPESPEAATSPPHPTALWPGQGGRHRDMRRAAGPASNQARSLSSYSAARLATHTATIDHSRSFWDPSQECGLFGYTDPGFCQQPLQKPREEANRDPQRPHAVCSPEAPARPSFKGGERGGATGSHPPPPQRPGPQATSG